MLCPSLFVLALLKEHCSRRWRGNEVTAARDTVDVAVTGRVCFLVTAGKAGGRSSEVCQRVDVPPNLTRLG